MEDEVLKKEGAELETSSEETTALTTINTNDLNQEALILLNQIIAETDIEKTKDLTYLFNLNQNKKTMVRMEKLNSLQDNLVDQFSQRIISKPGNISNQELMQGLKIVQDMLDKGQKQIVGTEEKPLIQINQQTNSVNMGENSHNLNRESRTKVATAVSELLSSLMTGETTKAEDLDIVDLEEPTIVEEKIDDK